MNVVGVNRHVPQEGTGVMDLPRAVRDLGAGAVREGLAAAALIYVPPLHPIVHTSPLAGASWRSSPLSRLWSGAPTN